METAVKDFIESPLYKSFEKWAEEEIGNWSCIIQDCLEGALFDMGLSRENVRWHINIATKHFQETHRAEIEAAWKKVLEKTNTTYNQVLEVQVAINTL